MTSGAWFGESFRSTEEIYRRAAVVAAALVKAGAKPGATVLLLARNSFLPLEVVIAAQQAALRVVPVSTHAATPEVEFFARDAGARYVIGDADLLRAHYEAIDGFWLMAQRTPSQLVSAYSLDPGATSVPEWALDYEDILLEHEPLSSKAVAVDASATTLFYTSGTTGRPKGVTRPVANTAQKALRKQALNACYDFSERTIGLVTTPLSHMLASNFAHAALAAGGTVVLMPKFDPIQFLELVQRHGVTTAPMVPTMFVRLLAVDKQIRLSYRTKSLKRILHTGAPCPRHIKHQMIDWLGPVLWEQYGSTETGMVALCDSAQWLAHEGTVGTTLLGSIIRIYDENGEECAPGVVGEIFARGPGMPDFSYLGLEQAREAVGRDGLVSAGDIGWLDEDGFLYVSDRRSDLIISGGNNVYPAEVEQAIARHPAIAECAVFGVPDDEFGQRVVGAYVRRPDHEMHGADELRHFLRTQLAGYKVPRELHELRSLPRNDSGKLLRKSLREEYQAREKLS